MKNIFGLLILAIAAFCIYWFGFKNKATANEVKQQALTLKKHSEGFNNSITNAMNAYFDMQSGFVDADSSKAKAGCKKFIEMVDRINLNELKKDTASIFETAKQNLADAKANALSLLQQTDLKEMRQDFHMISEVLYPSFFKSINYEGAKLYWQNCPMAFGDDKEANWISNTEEIFNPYLGKNHPEFKAAMLHCGSIKDSIMAK